MRVYAAAIVLTGLFCAILYKAYDVQIVQAAHYTELARRQHLKTVEIAAPRGELYDATGKELAVTADVDSVYANPREVVDVTGSAEQVANALNLDVREVEARLSSRRYFVWIKRHITVAEAKALQNVPLKGISLTKEPRRYYPGDALAGPVLGFADIDGVGLDGLELAMEELLAGKRAEFAALRDGRGRSLMSASPEDVLRAQRGASIDVTLDRNIQLITERALAEAIEHNKAAAGTAVVLDVRTGGVLAMASWPTYDPNAPARRAKTGARNRSLTDAFEVGSIMKVFVVAAALDAGVVRPDTIIDVEGGKWKVGRKVVRDTHHDQELTVRGVIKRSSNVGAVKIAFKLGAERLHDALLRFGFGSRTGIELPGERSGLVYPADQWSQLDLATTAYGYHMQVTAIQVAAALAAIGNGGILHEPRIVERATSAAGEVLYQRNPEGRRVLKEETARAMLMILASVFEKGRDGGTARAVEVPGFHAGGKTGTARQASNGKYDKRYLASFIGLAPINAPRIAVVVFVENPEGEYYYGGKVAGPVFGTVASETLRYLGVPASDQPADSQQAANDGGASSPQELADDGELPWVPPMVDEVPSPFAAPGDGEIMVPDFTGHSLARALDLARERGIRLQLEGSGRVISQEPPPGPAEKSTVCRIVLARWGMPE